MVDGPDHGPDPAHGPEPRRDPEPDLEEPLRVPGATPEVMEALITSGVGIVQMPCPEQRVFGLDKGLFGTLGEVETRNGFYRVAVGVVEDIAAYQKVGYQVVAVVGMDPSPSCGVTATKGKPAMLGVSSDTAEVPGSGLFFDSLRGAAAERRVTLPPLVGVRRVLSPAEGEPKGLDDLRRVLGVK